MDNDVILIRLVAALGLRAVRVPDLKAKVLFIRKHELMLIDTNLTSCDRRAALDRALRHWMEG